MALEMHSKELRGGTYLAPIFMATMLVALVLPMFFEVYRTVYYGTMSYDDYSRYLLWVLGEPGGKIPPSPHVYRIGSVILAAPFYQLPVILFSGQGIHHAPVVMQPEYVRALQAMCAANAAYAAISACLVGLYLAFWRNVSVGWAFCATLIFLLLTRYLGMGSADGIATLPLVIAAIAMIERRIAIFAAAVILGTIVNEKVALIAFFGASLRMLFVVEHRKVYFVMACVAAVALAAYAATVLTLAMPGLDNQRDPGTYVSGMIGSIRHLFGLKGAYQNLWPPIVVIILWWTAIRPSRDPMVYLCDIGGVIALFLFALALDVQYNVGRIVMFSMPLFLLGAVESMARSRLGAASDTSNRPVRGTAKSSAPITAFPEHS
ncbi:hypothetical protein TomTYG45_01810 [Sphingobium sp. TomTYG45]